MLNLKDTVSMSTYINLVDGYRKGKVDRAVNINGSMIYGKLLRVKDRLYLQKK
tara:strand:- start:2815 stop:2973 length:159 start_codon:yes stop_codon:yes gene_type:complete